MRFDKTGKSEARFRRWVTITLVVLACALCGTVTLTIWMMYELVH